MSEQIDSPATGAGLPNIDAAASQTSLSAGQLLRQYREAAGLHIGALAVSLKVPVKKLEALETDEYDLLPDTVFVRALASSVCRTLKIDPSAVLLLLPQTNSPKFGFQGVGTSASFRTPSNGMRSSMRTQISLPAVLACLILVLGALVLVFWPVAKSGWSQMMSITGPNAVGSAAARPLGETALVQVDGTDPTRPDDEEKLTKASSSSISVGPEIVPLIPALPTAMPSLVSDGLVKPLAAAYTTLVPLTGAVVSASDILVFRAKGNSWVEVTDSKGQVVLRRTLNAGETASASGALPLAAVVGRADSTQVQVRGKAFDLSGYAKDNVARFEVR